MKIERLLAVFVAAAFFSLAALTAQSQRLPPAIVSDPPADEKFPASMDAPDIVSHGSRLNAVFYLASGGNPHPTVLLLHGFPGNEKNLDLAYVLQRAGWNVLFPNYRGAWGSSGNFSFTNALGDAQSAMEFLRDTKNVTKYRIDPKRIVLVGHSMGGFIAGYTAAHDPEVSAVVMIAAWNLGARVSKPLQPEGMNTFRSASPRLAGTTPEGLYAEAKAHGSDWDYTSYAEQLKTRPVLVVEAKDGNTTDNHAIMESLRKAGSTLATEKYLEADHVFSDHRIALQKTILEWLATLPASASK